MKIGVWRLVPKMDFFKTKSRHEVRFTFSYILKLQSSFIAALENLKFTP
jgi:hypothetical protein